MDYSNQILEGDCTRLLLTLPEASVDLVVTDSPYPVLYMDRLGGTIAGWPVTIHRTRSIRPSLPRTAPLKTNSFWGLF